MEKAFPKQIPSSLSVIDPGVKLEKQIGIDVKKELSRIVKHMNFPDIEHSDLGEFILDVKKLLEQKSS